MKNKEILEGNKLIAKFMEWKKKADNFFESPIHGHYDDNFPNNLHFHESWDWLMPVVEKIESLEYKIIIFSDDCYIATINIERFLENSDDYNLSEEERHGSRLEIVYKTIVKFIKWYNKNK